MVASNTMHNFLYEKILEVEVINLVSSPREMERVSNGSPPHMGRGPPQPPPG